jgi:hypothetical protein
MVASVQGLVDDLAVLGSAAVPDAAGASAAARALEPVGRALGALRRPPADGTGRHGDHSVLERRVLVSGELAAACRAGASQWPHSVGRLVDMAGVLSDLVSVHVATAGTDQRWAASCALARTAGRLVEVAMRFPPYRNVPALQRVVRLTTLHRQIERFDPPVSAGLSWLQTTVAAAELDLDEPETREPVGLAAVLSAALERENRADTLTIYGALAAAVAAEAWTEHAIHAVARQDHSTANAAWRHCADGWRVVQAALIRFDDGSRLRGGPPSATIEHAVALHQALPTAKLPVERANLGQAKTISTARGVVNQLPELARRIEAALDRWGSSGRLFARARNLARRDEHITAIIGDRVVVAGPLDVHPVLTSTRVAARLSGALAVELDRTVGVPRGQPHSQLINAPTEKTSEIRLARDAQWASDLAARCEAMPPAASPTR